MKRYSFVGALVLALLLLAAPGWAAILTPGSWGSMVPPTNTGSPFYNQPSEDGPQESFLWTAFPLMSQILTGVGGGPVTFSATGLTGEFTLVKEFGDYQTQNRFGWFEMGGPSWGTIFVGSDIAGTVRAVSLPAVVGFWLLNPAGDFFTTVDDPDNFVLTRRTGPSAIDYLLGVEDLTRKKRKTADYNDLEVSFVERVKPPDETPVPEPTTLTLLGLGLLAGARKTRAPRGVDGWGR